MVKALHNFMHDIIIIGGPYVHVYRFAVHVLPINIISVLVWVSRIKGNLYVYKINIPVVTGIQMNIILCGQLASYTILLTF